ncbi:MAG TPA: PAS domain S-box protein [Pyrinomonadaceae bacterium]|nr:PAS domain S-box protein [Pyrinomonadaceae bacterium]
MTTEDLKANQIEASLEKSGADFHDLFENANDIIYVHDLKGNYISFNKAAEHIFGYTRNEINSMNMGQIVAPEYIPLIRRSMAEKTRGNRENTAYEVECITKGGQRITLEVNSRIITRNGAPFAIQGIARDITERKVTEEALRISEEQYRDLYENANDLIYTHDLKGNFTSLNRAGELITGYSCEEALNTNIAEIVAPELLESARQMIMRKVAGEKTEPYELKIITKDGRIVWLELNTRLMEQDGIPVGVQGIGRDVTERKRAESEALVIFEIIQGVATTSNLDELLEHIHLSLQKVLYAENCYVALYDKKTELLHIPFCRDEFDEVAPPQKLGKGLTAYVMRERRPMLLSAWDIEQLMERREIELIGTPPAIWMGVPLRSPSDIIGVLVVQHYEDPRVYTDRDLELLATAGDQIAIAIERKRASEEVQRSREELRKSREHLTLAQQVACVGSFEFDPLTRRVSSSPALESLYGVGPGELGETFEELISHVYPEDRQRIYDSNLEALTSGVLDSEFRIIRADGKVRWLNATGKVFYNDDGTPLRLVGVNMDITERKAVEEALRENEAKFRDLFDNAPVAYHELDTRGRFTRINHTEEMLLGYTNEELKGLHVWELVVEEDHREMILARLAGKSPLHPVERTLIRKDGSLVSVLKEDRLIYDAEGNIIGIRSTSQDITQRKLDEEQLKISAIQLTEANERAIREYDHLLKRLSTLAQETGAARDLGTIFTAILDFAFKSVPCSGLFISLYDKEQSTRKVIYMWYNGNEKDVSDLGPVHVGSGMVGKAIASGEVTIVNDYQVAAQKKPTTVYLGYDEDPREPHSTIIAPMKIMGNAVGVIEVQAYEEDAYTQEHATAMRMAANLAANAIENVRLLEQERSQAEQLREAQKLESVGQLAGGIAHDFNNMLTAINGYSDLILRKLVADDPIRKHIEEIKKAGERSASLTQQLLAFSRRQMLKPRVLDINYEVTEISTLLKRLIGEDIQLVTNLATELGRVEVDPGQLTQVILNLAVNSRDSMPQGGELILETGNVSLSAQSDIHGNISNPGDYIMISVKDTGEGMSKETQEHIFEPFFTTKPLGKGTGMGLATVYGIIKQSGGQISVLSELGSGTTFKIYLPRVEEQLKVLETTSLPEQTHKGTETILLVEDEHLVRNLSRDILKSCGYTIIEASDGAEALELCHQPDMKFDLLITDVVMPNLSGRQLVEELTLMRPDIKVLYMSGYTDDEVLKQGVIKINNNFIQKPFAYNDMVQKVRELLDA